MHVVGVAYMCMALDESYYDTQIYQWDCHDTHAAVQEHSTCCIAMILLTSMQWLPKGYQYRTE